MLWSEAATCQSLHRWPDNSYHNQCLHPTAMGKLQENIEMAWMKIKPSKSRSISIIKGKLSDQCFYIGSEAIPTAAGEEHKSMV